MLRLPKSWTRFISHFSPLALQQNHSSHITAVLLAPSGCCTSHYSTSSEWSVWALPLSLLPPLPPIFVVLCFAHKLLISAWELCWTPLTNQLLSERQSERVRDKIDWKSAREFGGALSKARVETPSLSKYYLRQQPLTAARIERGEKSHWFQTYLLYYIPSLSFSLSVRSASKILSLTYIQHTTFKPYS